MSRVTKTSEPSPTPAEPRSSAEGSPARISPSPADAADSPGRAAASSGRSSASSATALFGQSSSSSKTSLDYFPLAAVRDASTAGEFYARIGAEAARLMEQVLRPSSISSGARSSARRLRESMDARCAELQRTSGSGTPEPTRPWSSPRWRTSGTASATEFSTADTSESPRDGGACSSSLREILEPSAGPRYFLSPRAARGILSRSVSRGRDLPVRLQRALEQVASRSASEPDREATTQT